MQSEIDGRWIVESATKMPSPDRELAAEGNTFTISAGTLKGDDLIADGMYPSVCHVDAEKKHVDITPVLEGKPAAEYVEKGIYTIDGNRLTICLGISYVLADPTSISLVKSTRPTEFRGSDANQLIVLKRA